ncbi:tyrosine-type recombinase/integrase [Floccifex porci]|uniref:tyrosine-type recombinase/integrase n=1 Tax=Floccifex porci TaxID=2606629 RepID=UPI00389A9181
MYISKSNIERITPHGFRHSAATFLIQNRVDDTLIAERLGHTVNELRKTYAHVYKSMRNDMKNKLNELYSE